MGKESVIFWSRRRSCRMLGRTAESKRLCLKDFAAHRQFVGGFRIQSAAGWFKPQQLIPAQLERRMIATRPSSGIVACPSVTGCGALGIVIRTVEGERSGRGHRRRCRSAPWAPGCLQPSPIPAAHRAPCLAAVVPAHPETRCAAGPVPWMPRAARIVVGAACAFQCGQEIRIAW